MPVHSRQPLLEELYICDVRPVLVNAISQEHMEKNSYFDSIMNLLHFSSQSHSDLTKYIFGYNSKIHTLMMTKFHTNV